MDWYLAPFCPEKKPFGDQPKSDQNPPLAETTCSLAHVMGLPTVGTGGQKGLVVSLPEPTLPTTKKVNDTQEYLMVLGLC